MATRFVKLDDESEETLSEISEITGNPISESIRKGLILYHQQIKSSKTTSQFFNESQLVGGETLGDARYTSELLKQKKIISPDLKSWNEYFEQSSRLTDDFPDSIEKLEL